MDWWWAHAVYTLKTQIHSTWNYHITLAPKTRVMKVVSFFHFKLFFAKTKQSVLQMQTLLSHCRMIQDYSKQRTNLFLPRLHLSGSRIWPCCDQRLRLRWTLEQEKHILVRWSRVNIFKTLKVGLQNTPNSKFFYLQLDTQT